MLDKSNLPCEILWSSRGVEMHALLPVDGLFSVPASLDDHHGYSARFFFVHAQVHRVVDCTLASRDRPASTKHS